MFRRKGFTLVEIILVIVIVGILAGIVIPRILYTSAKAKTAACDANVAALNAQIELYHVQDASGDWPANLTVLMPDYIDAVPECPYNTNTTPFSYSIGANNRVPKHAH